jgi:hypothetical protein
MDTSCKLLFAETRAGHAPEMERIHANQDARREANEAR